MTTKTLDDPQVIERLRKVGVVPVAKRERSSEHLREFIKSEIADWREAVKASGIPIE